MSNEHAMELIQLAKLDPKLKHLKSKSADFGYRMNIQKLRGCIRHRFELKFRVQVVDKAPYDRFTYHTTGVIYND